MNVGDWSVENCHWIKKIFFMRMSVVYEIYEYCFDYFEITETTLSSYSRPSSTKLGCH